ncbi:hypothetical protein BU23DRAFT_73875 [Bimuria novae-zelandiae CBS 107.79]|uniref:Uncharacterized protein n=1 Tax=Bimuria novae-zelandiae CBS 107.79 TaxID=1447943 RepID=A0A6A5VHW7_9PLEO|nr:hypothetical protein BU23DRAFT_73875 [Bimuria novae-zelandiae CBS 107.79]
MSKVLSEIKQALLDNVSPGSTHDGKLVDSSFSPSLRDAHGSVLVTLMLDMVIVLWPGSVCHVLRTSL